MIDADGKIRVPVEGTVVSNNDPDGRYRVTVYVPGLFEPGSGWVRPTGTIGGGKAGRGGFLGPAEGSLVTLIFIGGDPDNPRYLCGDWPKGGLPENSDGGNPDVLALSLGGLRLVLSKGVVDDDYPDGRGKAIIYTVPGNSRNYIELDGETNSVTVSGITDTQVLADGRVKIKGRCATEISDRVVIPSPKPIS